MKLVSKILHIPPTKDPASTQEDKPTELALNVPVSGDAKELVVACIQQGEL